MKHLYKDCFEPRCAPRLGHLNERAGHPLNTIAYMLWDITPIFYTGVPSGEVRQAIIDVLEFALCSPNDACIEGALHGLGHMCRYEPALVEAAIDHFLNSTQDAEGAPKASRIAPQRRPIRRELRDYAGRARRGMVL